MTKKITIEAAVTAIACVVLSAAGMASTARAQTGWGLQSQQLRAAMLRSGELADFASRDCPVAVPSATVWAADGSSSSQALESEGYELGIRQTLHSASLGGLAFDSAALFMSQAGARAAEARVAAALRARGHAVAISVSVPDAQAYRVTLGSSVEYAVVFTSGRMEHSIDVELSGNAPASFGRQLADAARTVEGRS